MQKTVTNSILIVFISRLFAVTSVLFGLALMNPMVLAAETPSGAFICFGDGFAFSTETVTGWTFNQVEGKADGLCVVGYPISSAALTSPFKESPAVTFATVVTRFREGKVMTYQDIQTSMAEKFRESKPNMEIRDGDAIQVDGKKVIVRKYFPHPAEGQAPSGLSWDTVAYVEESQHFVTLVLSARSRESHDASYQAFRAYVRTYKFITKLSEH